MQSVSRFWMEKDPEMAIYLYVDGHVRVYHGEKAHLPVRYVSRQKLCLSGTTDYWVNDALGRPFLVVSQALNDGLAHSLLENIVPELLKSVPQQPTPEELEADPLLHRFVVIFDREGSTHSLLSTLWQQRIGAITYRKNVQDQWPESEFSQYEVRYPEGQLTIMWLAVRESEIKSGEKTLPVTEVRRLTKSGHQTSIICSAKKLNAITVAGRIFARWCQENYFSYMMQHYDIDGLIEYGSEPILGTCLVINPHWRAADKKVSLCLSQLRKLQGKLGDKPDCDTPSDVQKRAELWEEIQGASEALNASKTERKKLSRKVMLNDLTEEERATQLKPLSKALCDTIKMIAYRAETALVALLKPHLTNGDEARALVREILVSSANITPDDTARTLTVSVHRMSSPYRDAACHKLFNQLNDQQFLHPDTQFRMIFRLL
jgi:prepilin-type processing-associated H-X9-DG protein